MRLTRLRIGQVYYSPISMQHYQYYSNGTAGLCYRFLNMHTNQWVEMQPVDIINLEESQLSIKAIRTIVIPSHPRMFEASTTI